jgi:signal transduction histidine kinase
VSFRTRLFLAFGLAVLIPLGVLALGVRREMGRRLTAENARRAESVVAGLRAELDRESAGVAGRLDALTRQLATDNRFRLGVAGGDADSRRALLDLAGGMLRTSGLALLQIQDSAGRIVSSGHFRNQFDRLEPALPLALVSAGAAPVLVRARTADSTVVVLARLDSLRVAGERYTVAGGAAVEGRLRSEVARDPDLALDLVYPGGPADVPDSVAAGDAVVADLALPFLDAGSTDPKLDTARVVVTRSGATLAALLRSLDRWFLAALGISLALALALAGWLSSRISRPLTALAEQTAAIDFDRLDQRFASDRRDEVGALAGVLDAMTERLRQGAIRLREAERRMATGDLARQVNHDVKNGLAPIRNVLRHLAEVARDEPASLARNYARLSPASRPGASDVNGVAEGVVRAAPQAGVRVASRLAPGLPPASADPLVVRRILENLVGNAVESLNDRDGSVTVATERVASAASTMVRLTVSDTGSGMTREQLDRAFEDFHTTKPGGAGLGLSIVRRLVLDLGGSFRIETEPGTGTRAIVELPAMGDGRPT